MAKGLVTLSKDDINKKNSGFWTTIKNKYLSRGVGKIKSRTEETVSYKNPLFSIFDDLLPTLGNPDKTLKLVPGRVDVKLPLMAYHRIELSDARISKCLNDRRKAVLATPFDVYTDGQEENHKEVLDFVRWWVFQKIRFLKSSVENILDAFGKGFSVSEMVAGIEEYNGTQKIIITDIKSREPWQFLFDKEFNLRQLTENNSLYGEIRTRSKHIIFSYNSRYENPYGESIIGEKLFWLYMFKNGGIEFWIKFLNRLGVPPQRTTFKSNATMSEKQAMINAMQDLTSNGGILIPEGWTHEIIDISSKSGSSEIFSNLIEWCNREITICILSQELTTETQGTGSYSLGEIQQKQLQKTVIPDCELLAEVLTEQMILPIVKLNFGEQDFYPYIRFDSTEEKDQKKMAQTDKILYDMDVPLPLSYLQERYGIPEAENEEDVIQKITEIGTDSDTEGHIQNREEVILQ